MRKITFLKTMLLAAVLLVGSGNAWGQTTIYSETFGTPASTTVIGNYTGWSNSSVTYSGDGTCDVRNSNVSTTTDYSTASGTGNVMINNTTKWFKVSGINTLNFSNINLYFGLRKGTGTSVDYNTFKVYYSVNGGAETELSCSAANNNAGWKYITLNNFPATSNLSLRFKSTHSSCEYRLDDILLTGTPAPTCTASDLAFANPTVSKTTADAPFTVAATSLNATTAITYASDNTAAATVNETTGEVTVVGAGTAKITATQAAGTHAAVDYCASTAEYTLTVVSTTPTITITETSYETMGAVVGSTDTQTMHVSGINLTGSINLYFRADNSDRVKGKSVNIPITSVFEVSPATITTIGGTVASTPITITYTPLEAGIHRATLVVSSDGANTVELPFEGIATWAPLPAPVATDASGVNNAGFTANWEAVAEATEYDVDVYTKETGPAPNLVTNSGFETGATTGWNFESSMNQAVVDTQVKTGSYSLYASVLATKEITQSISLEQGVEHTLSFWYYLDPATTGNGFRVWTTTGATINLPSSSTYYNTKGSWERVEATFTPSANQMIFMLRLYNGCKIYLDDFNITSTLPVVTTTPIAGSPFTVMGETSKTISGLSAETTYYYTVTAYNNFVGSDVSNEVSVTTGSTTGVDKTEGNLNVGVSGNQIQFSASANQTVEVFNAVGQKLISRQTVDGLNTLTVSARGVVFVKLGDKVTKVIL